MGAVKFPSKEPEVVSYDQCNQTNSIAMSIIVWFSRGLLSSRGRHWWGEILQVDERLSELQSTLDAGIYHRNNVLNNIGYSLEKWTLMVCTSS
jgi:hypothetical protein